MKTRLADLWRWCLSRLPEALFVLFVLALVPMVVLGVRRLLVVIGTAVASPSTLFTEAAANLWLVAAVLVCLVGFAGLVVVMWRNWGLIWAVARKMILEAFHRKVVIVLLVFFVVLMPSLPFVLKTEGSLKSQVQIVLLYSLALGMVLLSLLAIFCATASICSEVERRHVHITDTKPLFRWQFLVGKWLGIVVMCTAVLYGMAGGTYVLIRLLVMDPDYDSMTAQEVNEARDERQQVLNEVLIARRSVTTPLPDVSAEVEAEIERLREIGKMSPYVHSFRKTTTEQMLSRKMSVPPGASHRWDFKGLEPQASGWVHVRFKGYWQGGRGIHGFWWPVRVEMAKAEGSAGEAQETMRRLMQIGAPPGGWTNNVSHELKLPARFINADGTLTLLYENAEPGMPINHSVVFDIESPVEVLQKEQGFLPNYYRSLLIILFHVGLLAALGLMAGALFSFPVATLLVACLFIGGLISPWFAQFVEPNIYARLTTWGEQLDRIWRAAASFLLALMPNFSSFSPLGDLVGGRSVPWGRVASAGSVLLLIKGGAAMLIGMYFYARRELARVIV